MIFAETSLINLYRPLMRCTCNLLPNSLINFGTSGYRVWGYCVVILQRPVPSQDRSLFIGMFSSKELGRLLEETNGEDQASAAEVVRSQSELLSFAEAAATERPKSI